MEPKGPRGVAGQPSEGARPLLGEETDRKSCLTSSNASSLLFFNWVLFCSPHKTRGLYQKASPCHQTIAAWWCQGGPQYTTPGAPLSVPRARSPPILPLAAFLLLLGQRATLRLSRLAKYNRHRETPKALPRHARLARAQRGQIPQEQEKKGLGERPSRCVGAGEAGSCLARAAGWESRPNPPKEMGKAGGAASGFIQGVRVGSAAAWGVGQV